MCLGRNRRGEFPTRVETDINIGQARGGRTEQHPFEARGSCSPPLLRAHPPCTRQENMVGCTLPAAAPLPVRTSTRVWYDLGAWRADGVDPRASSTTDLLYGSRTAATCWGTSTRVIRGAEQRLVGCTVPAAAPLSVRTKSRVWGDLGAWRADEVDPRPQSWCRGVGKTPRFLDTHILAEKEIPFTKHAE